MAMHCSSTVNFFGFSSIDAGAFFIIYIWLVNLAFQQFAYAKNFWPFGLFNYVKLIFLTPIILH